MYLVAIVTSTAQPVTDLATAKQAVRELVGPGRKVEIDDPEFGTWLVTLTRPLATELRSKGFVELRNAEYTLAVEWI